MRGSWVLIFHPWFGGHSPVAPPLDPPLHIGEIKWIYKIRGHNHRDPELVDRQELLPAVEAADSDADVDISVQWQEGNAAANTGLRAYRAPLLAANFHSRQ